MRCRTRQLRHMTNGCKSGWFIGDVTNGKWDKKSSWGQKKSRGTVVEIVMFVWLMLGVPHPGSTRSWPVRDPPLEIRLAMAIIGVMAPDVHFL